MRINIYLPDDLGEQAKAHNINISAVAQRGLRQELTMQDTIEKSQTITIDLESHKVAFEGTHVTNDTNDRYAYYVTAKGNVVVEDMHEQRMHTLSVDEFRDGNDSPQIKAEVLEALGEEYVHFLDI